MFGNKKKGQLPRYTHYKAQAFAWYVVSDAPLPGYKCPCGAQPNLSHILHCPATVRLRSDTKLGQPFGPPVTDPLDDRLVRIILKMGGKKETNQMLGWHLQRIKKGEVVVAPRSLAVRADPAVGDDKDDDSEDDEEEKEGVGDDRDDDPMEVDMEFGVNGVGDTGGMEVDGDEEDMEMDDQENGDDPMDVDDLEVLARAISASQM
jgi:hypothetical protein